MGQPARSGEADARKGFQHPTIDTTGLSAGNGNFRARCVKER